MAPSIERSPGWCDPLQPRPDMQGVNSGTRSSRRLVAAHLGSGNGRRRCVRRRACGARRLQPLAIFPLSDMGGSRPSCGVAKRLPRLWGPSHTCDLACKGGAASMAIRTEHNRCVVPGSPRRGSCAEAVTTNHTRPIASRVRNWRSSAAESRPGIQNADGGRNSVWFHHIVDRCLKT
jgi:hypothetical protein